MAKKRQIKRGIIDPKSTDSLWLFIIGSILSGFAFAVGMRIADMVIENAKKTASRAKKTR